MKKTVLLAGLILLFGSTANAEDNMLREIDAEARMQNPNTNSLMFRRNAEQYRQLSDAEKEEIAARRKMAKERRAQEEEFARRKAMEQMRRQEEEAMKRAEEEARREAERRRAEALKPITLYENKLKIYALVNGEIISSNDMQSRINLFIMTTGIPYNNQTRAMITGKVLQAAIDEKLKLQEAQKNKIKISKKEISSAIRQFEDMNKIPAGQMTKILTDAKVSVADWKKEIEADLAWRKLINSKGYSEINITRNDINEALQDIKKGNKVQRYMLSEIVINRKDAKGIEQLVENLRHDPRFELYAMQFSQSPSSANGGKLGWVIKGRLPSVLENVVSKMKEGAISDPVAYGENYYIYRLEKIFNPATDKLDLPSEHEIRSYLENKKLEEFSEKYIKDLRSRALIEKKV